MAIGIGIGPAYIKPAGIDSSEPGTNPDDFAPYPAPEGFHWVFVTNNGETVTVGGEPVVTLEEL